MKTISKLIALSIAALFFFSCTKKEEDEGKLPYIAFVQDSGHVSKNQSLPGGSLVLVGIEAHKTEENDVLKRFDISLSENGAEHYSVFNKALSGTEVNAFAFDTLILLDTVPGNTFNYIFSVTNRDGLMNKVSLELSVQ